MYSSSYSSLYQHTATTTPNPYSSTNTTSPLAPFNNGLATDQTIDQSSNSSSSSQHTSMTSPLGNFSTRNNNLSSTTNNNNPYLQNNPYNGNEDLITNNAYQLVSGGRQQQQQQQQQQQPPHHHSLPTSSSSNTILTPSTASPFSFQFPPLPHNDSNLDTNYNLYQSTSSPSTAPRRRGHKASSSSLASILIKPELSADSSTIRTRNPSPHRPSASITTATAGLSLGDNNSSTTNNTSNNSNTNQDSSYPYSHHRRRSSSTSLSPLKSNTNNNTSNSTAASTPNASSSSLSASNAAAYRAHRRRRSAKNHSIDRDSIILSLYKQGKSLSEIARVAGLETEEEVRLHYESIVNRRVDWTQDDIDCLKELLESGERAKWKYISEEVSRDRNKRIPATACQKKFKEMFGVAEASSILGSSLCYVVFPEGWACLDTKPIDLTAATPTNRQPLQSVYENEQLIQ